MNRHRTLALTTLAALAVVALLQYALPLWPLLDRTLQDSLARLLPQRAADPDMVLLDIDEPALAAMSEEHGRYPWSRAVFGALVEGLARQRPAAIVFDIQFVDPHKEHPEEDVYFVHTVQRAGPVYFPVQLLSTGAEARGQGVPLAQVPGVEPTAAADPRGRAPLLLPLPGLIEAGRLGHINARADADGVLRRYALYLPVAGYRIPGIAARVARDLGYPLPPGETFALDWRGPAFSYPRVSLHEVFFDLERRQPQRPANEFAGKIVLIGSTASGLHDLHNTAVGANYPGLEVLATALDNLKHGDAMRAGPVWLAPLVPLLVLALLAGLALGGRGVLMQGLTAGAVTVALLVLAIAGFVGARLLLPVTAGIGGAWLYFGGHAVASYLAERRNRERITGLFQRFLDPRVVQSLVDHGDRGALTLGQKRDITVLFSDIRGFTTLSERKSAQEIVDILNRYFALQVEVIFRHGGTLDKYIGDAIMAFWGAPTEQPDHAQRALAAAAEMVQTLQRFKTELGAEGAAFDVGIGLHSGEAVVGFIGSASHRQDYTAIGDTVNTASRIEGATKGRARILVSAATRERAGPGWAFTDHGIVELKGKTAGVQLYEPRHTTDGTTI